MLLLQLAEGDGKHFLAIKYVLIKTGTLSFGQNAIALVINHGRV